MTSTPNNEATRPGNKWPSVWFPLGYKEGFSQWWANLPAAAAEHKVLSFVPYLQQVPTQTQTGNEATTPKDAMTGSDSLVEQDTNKPGQVTTAPSHEDPYGPRRWRSSMVELSGKNRALNEFSVERVGEPVENNLVILHGYGAGLGFFYKNFEAFSRAKGWQLYALDMLGMGRSTRPPFKLPGKGNRQESIEAAEDWFIDALEEWRQKRNIERFTLLGHSLGGYMAVAYALKYPGRLNKLILASPVGIPEDPYAVQAELPTQDASYAPDQSNPYASQGESQPTPTEKKEGQVLRRPLPKWFSFLWDSNISPFTIVRWAGPFGPRLVSGWTHRRFSQLPTDEARALHDYAYSLFRLKGSGEYALAYVLAPGAFARSPLIRRIQGVGRQLLSKNPNAPGIPTLFGLKDITSGTASPGSSSANTNSATNTLTPSLPPALGARELAYPVILLYGSHDWMDVKGGFAAAEKINAEREKYLSDISIPEQLRKRDRGWARVQVVNNAGHHLYLDGWQEFNDIVLKEMEEVAQAERERRSGMFWAGERINKVEESAPPTQPEPAKEDAVTILREERSGLFS